jgi:zinc transporter ZupT
MTDAQGLALGVCLVLSVCHLVASRVQRRLERFSERVGSFSGGLASAYVFLELFPQLESTHKVIGERIHAIVLAGFVFLFVVDTLFATAEKGAERGGRRFALRLSISAVYNFLVAFTLSEQLPMTVLTSIAYAIALGLHLLSVDLKMVEEFGHERHRWARFVLVAALLGGWVLSWQTDFPEMTLDVLTAMMAGFIVYTVFGEELPNRMGLRVRWFVTGALSYFALDLLSAL